jgi:hypothetical protein
MMRLGALFYFSLVLLHGLGAILSMGLSFGCDTGRAVQTARVPERLPAANIPQNFLAAYPWDEGAEFYTHQWNPFALIFVFEWLTAAFALRPLLYYYNGRTQAFLYIAFAWLAVGLVLFIGWCATNSGGVHTAMLITGIGSFLVTAWLCDQTFKSTHQTEDELEGRLLADRPRDDDFKDLTGRVWKVPRRVAGLRYRGVANGEQGQPGPDKEERKYEIVYGVVFRYAEYCLTAPLLFLAVVCLLVVDAPGWLFLTGFWLVLVCNALGIALHLSVCAHRGSSRLTENAGLMPFFLGNIFSTPW